MLAGGQSLRFGSDKALALWRGERLIDRAVATLTPWCETVVVVGRDWPGQVRIDDVPGAGLGPLGGIAGALNHAQYHGFDSVLTIACDMPEVPAELLEKLSTTAPSHCADAPVLGHWPTTQAKVLISSLNCTPAQAGVQSGFPPAREHKTSRSIRAWARSIGSIAIPAIALLPNINTPADLTA